MGRRKKKIQQDLEFESQFVREAEFDNADIVKEIKEEVSDAYPDLKVKIRLSRKNNEADNIVFKFENELPEKAIVDGLKLICRPHQQVHYRKTKFYSQWEANFRPVFKVKETEEEQLMEEEYEEES